MRMSPLCWIPPDNFKLRTPLNIFIGGQVLDRGVTLANLIGFYYGRRPNKFNRTPSSSIPACMATVARTWP